MVARTERHLPRFCPCTQFSEVLLECIALRVALDYQHHLQTFRFDCAPPAQGLKFI